MNKNNTAKRGGAFALVLTAFLTIGSTVTFAGAVAQTDTNSLAILSTNTIAIPSDVSGFFTNGETISGQAYIDGSKTTQLIGSVGGFFTNSTANASNVVFNIAQSVDGVNWVDRGQTVLLSVKAAATNWSVAQFTVTAPAPLYALRSVENTNTAVITARAGTLYLKTFAKTGL